MNRVGLYFCFSILSPALAGAQETARTPNFIVHAANREFAEQVGKQAEAARKTQAMHWLGREMRPWKIPCDLRVKISLTASEGFTTMRFDGGKVLTHDMEIRTSRERLPSVLAHELTHTVFAHALGKPVPRWADEGAAMLDECEANLRQHDFAFGKMLEMQGRVIPLRRLFVMKEYPEDTIGFYAEGFSVARYLIERKDRATFLAFVKTGDEKGWEDALRTHYDIRRIEELEKVWLKEQRRRGERTAGGAKP